VSVAVSVQAPEQHSFGAPLPHAPPCAMGENAVVLTLG
jgi:hypothetical protein